MSHPVSYIEGGVCVRVETSHDDTVPGRSGAWITGEEVIDEGDEVRRIVHVETDPPKDAAPRSPGPGFNYVLGNNGRYRWERRVQVAT